MFNNQSFRVQSKIELSHPDPLELVCFSSALRGVAERSTLEADILVLKVLRDS